MEVIIFFTVVGFAIGYLACFYLTLYMGVRKAQDRRNHRNAEVHAYPPSKQSPNKAFIERYGDRRKPDQTWGEQLTRAFPGENKRPVLVRKIKP